ncbi:MAG: hypothetical protein GDA53_06645 [Rhodobacteraceae bacterium]|nr:hypothetical protein [Paracoccaceae bacterium]
MAKTLFAFQDQPPQVLDKACALRNAGWAENPMIPAWVNPETVSLDRIFTRPSVAEKCYNNLLRVMLEDHAETRHYTFVDPSAGDGVFYDLLPPDHRTGIELVPGRSDFVCQDFLTWKPSDDRPRYAVIGNPPFGYRAWLALAFVNHAATFADYIGMILPMGFQSNGKGSPKFRVRGAELVNTMDLPSDAFVTPEGKGVQINALWQVWRRGVNNRKPVSTCREWVELFTIDRRKERLCGQDRLGRADWLLQRTFYNTPPTLVTDFRDVKYGCGYGVIIRKDKPGVTAALRNADWREHSNLAAHNCRHISMEHIQAALVEAGFVDAA